MGIFVARTNDLKGMNLPAAPAAASGSLAAFRKAGSAQGSRNNAAEILKLPRTHRLDFCGIDACEAGTFICSILLNSRRRGHLDWRICAESVAARFTAHNYFRIKLPLKRASPEDALMWILRGWMRLGKRTLLQERITGHLI